MKQWRRTAPAVLAALILAAAFLTQRGGKTEPAGMEATVTETAATKAAGSETAGTEPAKTKPDSKTIPTRPESGISETGPLTSDFSAVAANIMESEARRRQEETEALGRAALPQLSDAEKELLDRLYHYMKWRDLAQAAELMNGNAEPLRKLLDVTFSGKKYLYRERDESEEGPGVCLEELTADTSGTGLILTRPDTAFFGEFSGGKPEGNCLAVQAAAIGQPRYTYADGIWKSGRMDGGGSSGYCLCGAPAGDGLAGIRKTGVYDDNLLDGNFTYMAESGEGETWSWQMRAAKGVTVIDGRWRADAAHGQYQLPADGQPKYIFTIDMDRTADAVWRNLIRWDE